MSKSEIEIKNCICGYQGTEEYLQARQRIFLSEAIRVVFPDANFRGIDCLVILKALPA